MKPVSTLCLTLLVAGAAQAQEARKVTATSLTVRSGPGTTYASLGTAYLDQEYVVYSTSGSWLRIFWNGNKGWVHSSYTAVVAGTGVEITPSTLNVYASSSTLSSVVGQAKGGDVYVLSTTLGSWRRIWFAGVQRWVQAGSTVAYTLSSGSWNVPSNVGEVQYQTYDVRASASATASVIGQIHPGERYVWTAVENGFQKFWFGHTIGYVTNGALGGIVIGSPYVRVSNFSATVWSVPGSGATVLGHVHRGQYYAWIGSSGNRIQIRFRGAAGWVEDSALGQHVRTEMVSRSANGSAVANGSAEPAISADGRFVAFSSVAINLVSGDTNNYADIFVYDRQTGIPSRVSVASDGTEANYASTNPVISLDGRYVAFRSYASNLVPGDTNGKDDIFVHDRQTATTTRVSVSTGGLEANDLSYAPVLSPDGRYVAFTSYATNLVPGDANGQADVFVRDLWTGVTTCISVATNGTQGDGLSQTAAFSADHRYVAFQSWATNLVSGDTNGQPDIFVRDVLAGTTTRVSLAGDGSQGDNGSWGCSLSADGRYLAFASKASNLVSGDTNGQNDVFVRDLQLGTVSRVSVTSAGAQTYTPNINSVEWPVISADGRYVAWASYSYTLVTGDTNYVLDVFVHDRQTGSTSRVSVGTNGAQGNGDSKSVAMSPDGRYVAFDSMATTFATSTPYGTNVFVRKRW